MAEERTPEQLEVRLSVEVVPCRSTAWDELWRQILVTVAEELDRVLGSSQPDEPEGSAFSTEVAP